VLEPDLVLVVTGARWEGLGSGHGHLRVRRVRVEATGRRDAARPRRADLVLGPGVALDTTVAGEEEPGAAASVVALRARRAG
jgi:hypothetical protein